MTEYMEALGHAFGRAIEKGKQEGLAAGIEHGQAGRCLTDLKAYIPSAEVDFNSVVRDLRDLNFPLLQELSNKKDASTLESTIAEKDRELSDLGASSSSLKFQNQSLINQVHELKTSSTELREKPGMYEGSLKQLEEFQDNLMRPLETRTKMVTNLRDKASYG
ncbi:hypothetical protein Tco_1188515 [Tanacetum coccineum]